MAPVRRGLGILGGTFDPPHIGHIAAAVEVRSALHLDRVLLMVANDPWQKTGTRLLSEASDRLAMVSAAVEGLDGLEASGLEIDRGGVTYTIDTLQVLRSAAPDQQLFLIVGSDAASNLHTWHRFEELQDLATLVVVDRCGDSDVEPPPGWSAVRVSVPRLDISSSELRDRVRSGRPLEPFVGGPVINEIRSRGLYGLADS
jgi:nicotinate-nucleotide adenylyltransferase